MSNIKEKSIFKKCLTCNRSNQFDHLFVKEKDYPCSHTLEFIREEKELPHCNTCALDQLRKLNGLNIIHKDKLKENTCLLYKIGLTNSAKCWDINKKCDIKNCSKYPLIIPNNYKIISEIKKILINMQILYDVYKIIFEYTDFIFMAPINGHGLCFDHNNIYLRGCRGCLFNIPVCLLCCEIEMCKEKYHHVQNIKCNFLNCCIETCKRINSWCNICNTCIGHSSNININIHCKICNEHNIYNFCNMHHCNNILCSSKQINNLIVTFQKRYEN
jgi:hypothetical protein